ncbi:MAG: alginate export family protein [Gammaproteobacteria bacterium]|nr:alginate export family protein [Gammaproteobacteria bacterium]
MLTGRVRRVAIYCLTMALWTPIASQAEQSILNALIEGKPYAQLNLRWESVQQENALRDADAVTLRSRLGYQSENFQGWRGALEVEAVRTVLGVNDYSVPPSGFNAGQFSVIADPQTTELDQLWLQYQQQGLSLKLGRQVITLDNHRFVGHVGWRQDRQTFDGLRLDYQFADGLRMSAARLLQRNRIFATDQDVQSSDTLIRAEMATRAGKLSAYAYLLSVDDVADSGIDSIGVRLVGGKTLAGMPATYAAEFAAQDTDTGLNTDYFMLEGGLQFDGVRARLGYEVLGSDAGRGAVATPLATLHKFNGWADQFLSTPDAGLRDVYLSLGGKVWRGRWQIIAHQFKADAAIASKDDLGREWNLQFTRKFARYFNAGIKLASYSAGDARFGKVDTDKLWVWWSADFS